MSTSTNSSAVTPAAAVQTADITSPIVTTGEQPVVASPTVDNTPNPAPDPAAPAPTPAATAPAQPDDWAIKRINEVTAKRHEAERKEKMANEAKAAAELKNAELTARLAELTKGGNPAATTTTQPDPVKLSEEEINKRAAIMAEQIARQNEFTKTCNGIAEEGKKEFRDWSAALENLKAVGALGDGSDPTFLQAAVELKNSHKVLHHLGTNLSEAERIAKLPPVNMAMELARVEAQLNAPAAAPVVVAPAVSQAPPPVIPTVGAAKPPAKDISDSTISMDDFMAIRAEQEAARRKRYLRAQ